MEALEEETYADFIRPESMDGVEPSKPPPKLSRQPAMSARRYRLSLSPLDSLQAEFKKYNNSEQSENTKLLQSPLQRTHNFSRDGPSERPLSRKQTCILSLPSNPSSFSGLTAVDELPDSVSNTPDWEFLKNSGIELPRNSECPSLFTGSTISSRNSSTRSTRSAKWEAVEPPAERDICPYPGCGRVLRDLASHLLTHQAERPEKCPIQDCEYHAKGFARAYDRVRHTISHFKETMVCGFCPITTPKAEKTFTRCDTFLKHLVNTHGVEQMPAVQRDESYSTSKSGKLLGGQKVSTCKLCSEPFDAQGFYEHLRGCALRQVTRNCTGLQLTQGNKSNEGSRGKSVDNDVPTTAPFESLCIPRTPEHLYAPFRRPQPPLSSIEGSKSPAEPDPQDIQIESKEMAELTASSRCLSLTSSQEDTTKSSDEETDWTDDTGSPVSIADAENLGPVLSPVKQQLVERLMQEFHRIFARMIRSHHGAGAAGSAGYGYYTGSSGSSTYSSSSFISRKRSLSGGSSPPPDDNGDDSNKRRRPDPKHNAGKQNVPELRFACPYYKRNPGRHQTFTSCRDPGFITVARLKEHLYRRHLLPIQCNRCCATFANEPSLRDHQRDRLGCEIKDQVPLEGFDKDQERKLKSKKRSLVYQSEEDKWKGVYRILFPDDLDVDMPSPYIEYQPCTNGSQTGESSNIARFQEFSRLELPRLVRRTLEVTVEEEAQPLEERLKERLVDIVRDCQTQLISLFQSTQNQPPDAPPPSLSQAHLPNAMLPAPGALLQPPPTLDAAGAESAAKGAAQGSNGASMFHNFSSFPPSAPTDYIPIPTTYPLHEHEHPLAKTETEPPAGEAGSRTPDSGYDSTLNVGALGQEAPSFAGQHGFADARALPFAPGPQAIFPQHQQQQIHSQHAFHPGAGFSDEFVDLGGYYGLFQERGVNAGFGAGIVEPPWGYLDDPGSMVGGGGHGSGTRNGAGM